MMFVRKLLSLSAAALVMPYASSVISAEPERKVIEVGVRSYLVVLDKISLAERGTRTYTVTHENEPPSFVNQQLGVYLESRGLGTEGAKVVADKIDRTIIAIRILDAATNELMFDYQGPLFQRDVEQKRDRGLVNGAWLNLPDGGIRYLRSLDGAEQYRLDKYYKLFGIETPFRERTSHRIEFAVLEPMVSDPLFGGTVLLVIRGGRGK